MRSSLHFFSVMTGRGEKAVVGLSLLVTIVPLFSLAARRAVADATVPPDWFVTPLDRAIPVLPAAVWIYVSWYPASASVLLCDVERFRRASLAYTLAFGICLAGYATLPFTIARPAVAGAGPSDWMLATLYALDPPVNLVPSFHAAAAIVLALVLPSGAGITALARIWAAALCCSCLLTKQHYVVDVLAGGVVGVLAALAADVLCGRSKASVRTERLRRLGRPLRLQPESVQDSSRLVPDGNSPPDVEALIHLRE